MTLVTMSEFLQMKAVLGDGGRLPEDATRGVEFSESLASKPLTPHISKDKERLETDSNIGQYHTQPCASLKSTVRAR